MHRFAVLALLAACYSPNPGVGGPCSEQGFCPAGQMCFGGKCLTAPPETDAAIDAESDAALIDARIDAPPLPTDAALDAFVSPTWLTPTRMPGIISGGSDSDPCLTADRLTIAFQRNNDIWLGTRATPTSAFSVAPLTVLNSATADDSSPAISADGRTIYFTSDRVLSNGNDVYVSTFNGSVWSAPAVVTQLSTGSDDTDIGVSRDGLVAVITRSGTSMHKATRLTTSSVWGAPVIIPNVWPSSIASPSINDAGDIYFHATDPRDLYVARRNGVFYNAPTAIAELNTGTAREASPEIWSDDLYLAFEIDGDLWETRR